MSDRLLEAKSVLQADPKLPPSPELVEWMVGEVDKLRAALGEDLRVMAEAIRLMEGEGYKCDWAMGNRILTLRELIGGK